MKKKHNKNSKKIKTLLSHTGRHSSEHFGLVNVPVSRGSTILFETLEKLENHSQRYAYGRTGNPSTDSVEQIVTQLENAAGTVLTPSGLSAISLALLSCLEAGNEILVADCVYDPTRKFCNKILSKLGISTRYFDPNIGSQIETLITEKTKVIFLESPGSLTFELQDLPLIAKVAKKHDISILIDNSWATPLFYRPLELGADIVIHAATKMFVGHSDVMGGTISANETHWERIKETHYLTGTCMSPDDAFLVARGLRTLDIRMQAQMQSAIELATWLEKQEVVKKVLHPALPSHPNHAIFRRDFSGSGSVFSIVLKEAPNKAMAALVDNLDLFGMGYSWGGYESLVLPAKPEKIRTAIKWNETGNLLRIHVGLEDIEDLRKDLLAGLERYKKEM